MNNAWPFICLMIFLLIVWSPTHKHKTEHAQDIDVPEHITVRSARVKEMLKRTDGQMSGPEFTVVFDFEDDYQPYTWTLTVDKAFFRSVNTGDLFEFHFNADAKVTRYVGPIKE